MIDRMGGWMEVYDTIIMISLLASAALFVV